MARERLTAGRIAAFKCPPSVKQAFLWDTDVRALALRATAAGAKAFVCQHRLDGKSVRITIGKPADWSIDEARRKAREFLRDADEGTDSREKRMQTVAAARSRREAELARTVLARDAWDAYLKARMAEWGGRHLLDHQKLSQAGGEKPRRGVKGGAAGGVLTKAGPLHALLARKLAALDDATIKAWAKHEAGTRPTRARLALRLLEAFMTWCAQQPEYRAALAGANPAKNGEAKKALGKPKAKRDVLLKEQLPAWFGAVRAIANPVHAAYFQALLLAGCRPSEMLALKWDDIDERWRSLRIRDKVDGERMIPLTPFVWSVLGALPRRNQWVFSSLVIDDGHVAYPTSVHTDACKVAGLDGLTLHGLRRSFRSLSEWLDIPTGVVAQIQGHKPSATVEKHYAVRPLDLLRVHHERFEAWVIEKAGLTMPAADPRDLRVVQ
ncbi:MAG: tyrosine-type recombinase/integrase [Lautropia sp.]